MSKDIVRVLLVEDSPSDAGLLCESLQDYPLQRFEIERAERLNDALAWASRKSFDVILLDLNLPDSSGLETCQRMARAAGQVPIIILTGAEDEALATEAMRVGVQDYLVKAQALGGVIGRTIRYAVERSQAQQALREAHARLQERAEELTAQAEELQTANEELRQSERALHTAEERLHLAMEAGRVGTWEWDVGTEAVQWSQGIYPLLGYRPGAVTPTHQALRRRIHPQDLARQDQALEDSLERCEDYRCEFRVVWADGSVHWVEARGQYTYGDDKKNGIVLRMRGILSDIDRRKQAEEALRESEARNRRLIENLKGSHFIYQHDVQGVFQYLSESITDVLGYTPEEFMTHYDRYLTDHPVNRAVQQHTELSIQGVRQPPYEVHIRHKDGSTRWLEVQEVPVLDDQGRVRAVEGVAQDITTRKEAEEALRRSERQFRSTFENAAMGIAHVTLDGHIVQFNRRFGEIAGYRAEEIIGKTCEEITFADDWKAEREQLQRLLTGAVPHYSIEKRYLRQDGSPVWVNLTRSLQRDEVGKAEYFIVIVEDISARKWMEEALRESEQWFRTLANAMPQLVWTADPDGRVDYYNDRYQEFRGIEPTPDGDFHWAPVVHVEDQAATIASWERAVRTGETYQIEHRVQRVDGSYHWYLSRGTPVRDREGRIVKWFGTATDIDNVKRAEEALREWNAALESRVAQRTAELLHRTRQLQKLTLELSETEDRERQRMAEILHDDLQQVLAAAKFHVSLMRNRAKYDASLQTTATRIDQMLADAIAKSRSLSHELSPAVMHHGNLVETLRWLAQQVQAQHGLHVRVQAQSEIRAHAEALKSFLYKAAQELLFNVVKHARVREARIRVRSCHGCIYLSVSDRGRGFDPQGLREAAGFGLLNIRERVELLGGRMKITSAAGRGSRFSLVVPNGQEPEEAVGVGPRAYPTAATPGDSGKKEGDHGGVPLRVLLADDHAIVRQGLVSVLGEEQTVEIVGEATNGREAVNLANQLRPDVVIMDVSMPIMGGEEATRQIKKDLPQTRIVSLSMWDDPEVRERMYGAGAEGYVLKTAPTEELLAALRGKESDS